MESLLAGLDARLRDVETAVAASKGTQEIRIQDLQTQCVTFRDRLDAVEKAVEDLTPWVRGVKWLAGLVGVAIVALLWAILTHSITLVGP